MKIQLAIRLFCKVMFWMIYYCCKLFKEFSRTSVQRKFIMCNNNKLINIKMCYRQNAKTSIVNNKCNYIEINISISIQTAKTITINQ